MKEDLQEEIVVIFHAALLGRTDVLKNAIASIRASGKYSDEEVRHLISTSREDDGATPLHIATHYGHTDVIRALLNAGADMSFRPKAGEFSGKRPYDIAQESARATYHVFFFEQIAMGRIREMEALLRGGIPLSLTDESASGDSALHWAASFGHVQMVKALLSNGFPIDMVNQNGMTALHVAVKSKAIDVLRVLLEEGANVDVVDDQQKTARELALEVTSPASALQESLLHIFDHPPVVTKPCHQAYLATLQEEKQRLEEETCLSSISAVSTNTTHLKNSVQVKEHEKDEFTGPYSSTVVFEAEDDFFEDSDEDNDFDPVEHNVDPQANDNEDIFLVFWPPVFRQKRRKNAAKFGLKLCLDENLVIGVVDNNRPQQEHGSEFAERTSSMLSLVRDSGLLQILDDTLGFQVQVKRLSPTHPSQYSLSALSSSDTVGVVATTSKDLGPKILLQLDQHRCPLPQSFLLITNSKRVKLIAGDMAGLLYACYALIQLIQLHSERPQSPNKPSPSPFFSNLLQSKGDPQHHGSSRRLGLVIPEIVLEDRPTTAAIRAVTWPYRPKGHVLSDLLFLQKQIVYFSQLRLNRIYLLLDPDVESNQKHSKNGRDEDDEQRTWKDLRVLDALCRRLQIELVPTVVLTSLHDRLPTTLLHVFSQPLIHLIFLVPAPVSSRNLDGSAPVASNISEWQRWYSHLLLQCQQSAFRSVQCSYSTFLRSCVVSSRSNNASRTSREGKQAHEVYIPRGLSLWETSLAAIAPSRLQEKPLLAQEAFLAAIASHVQTVEESGDALVVFPLFVERDFLYPVLFQKFHAAYFAGLSWQRATACDMLGDPASPAGYDGAVLRDVLRILLFPALFALPSTAPHASREVAPAAPISNVIAGSGGSLSPRPSSLSLSTSASANNLHAASGSSSLPSASSGTLATSSATAASTSLSQSLKRSASLLLQCVLLQRWDLLYQQTLLSSDSVHISNSMHAQGNIGSNTNNVSREEMYEAEVALWRLIHLPAATTANHDAAWEFNDEEEAGADEFEEEKDVGFHRSQAALTLKCYRRMLAVAAWRPHAPPASFAASSSAGKKDTSLVGSRIGGGLPSGGDIRGSSPIATSSTSLSFLDFLLGRSSAATASPAPAPSSETMAPSTTVKLTQSEEEEEEEEERAHHSSSRYHRMVVTSGSKDEPVLTLLDQQQQSHLHYHHANLQDLEEELDEIFALLHLLAIVSKVLLQTDHASSKQQQHNNQPLPATNHANLNPHQLHHHSRNMRLRQQFQSLSVSTRSDVANMLLEALHLCTRRCQTRIDTDRWLPALRHTCVAALPVLRAKGGSDRDRDRDRVPSQEDTRTRRHRSMVKQGWGTEANRRHRAFLLTPRPVSSSSTAPMMEEDAVDGDAMHELRYQAQLPALAVFQLLCEGLVLPATVQDFLWRIFQTTTTTS